MDKSTQQQLCDLPAGLELIEHIDPGQRLLIESQTTAFCTVARQLRSYLLGALPEEVAEEATPGACWGALIGLAVKVESTNEEAVVDKLGVVHMRLFLDVMDAADKADE